MLWGALQRFSPRQIQESASSLRGGELKGTCTMKVMLDDLLICKFEHHNPDGLAACVRRAADAVELSEWAEKMLRDDAKGG